MELEGCLAWHIESSWQELDHWVVTYPTAQNLLADIIGRSVTGIHDCYRSLVVAELSLVLLWTLEVGAGELFLFRH